MRIIFAFFILFPATVWAADCACQDDVTVQITTHYTSIHVYKSLCKWSYTAKTVANTNRPTCEEYPLVVEVTTRDGSDTKKTVWSEMILTATVRGPSTPYTHREGTREARESASHFADHCISSLTKTSQGTASLPACCQR